jgi:predicted kinase
MQKKVWMMCGLAGSGKSTFCNKMFPAEIIVAEDIIRYQVEDAYGNTDWDIIIQAFHNKIQTMLETYDCLVIDASFVDLLHRELTVDFIRSIVPDILINFIVITTPVSECLCRNNARIGRARIDKGLIFRQSMCFTDPVLDQKDYNTIIYINQNSVIEKIR